MPRPALLYPVPLLLKWREARVMTQAHLAQRAGVTRLTLSRLENGDAMARPSTLRKIADALGISVDDLLHGEPGIKSAAPASQQGGASGEASKAT